jgi:uncharacterized protein (TIGR03084 family)
VPTATDICPDLVAEQEDLEAQLGSLTRKQWQAPTPAVGWTVQDSVAHICYFDETAALAATDPAAFEAHRLALRRQTSADGPPDLAFSRSTRDPSVVLDRWRTARRTFVEAIIAVDPKARVPWYGLAMSPASLTTARLMETWAHGVDVRDAVGTPLAPTHRLRHVCDLGYRARAYAFASHDVEDPGDPVGLIVAAPDGGQWTWGPDTARDTIRGPALDVALVFTQRRHPSRTAVVASGPTARRWLTVAQAFAGPGTRTDPDR